MKKIAGVLAVVMTVLMIAALFTSCGENYDGTYKLVEMSSGSETITKDQIEQAGASITLTISGDKATMDKADGSKTELSFDAGAKTFSADGESIPATFDGNRCTLEQDGVKMVFEK